MVNVLTKEKIQHMLDTTAHKSKRETPFVLFITMIFGFFIIYAGAHALKACFQ